METIMVITLVNNSGKEITKELKIKFSESIKDAIEEELKDEGINIDYVDIFVTYK